MTSSASTLRHQRDRYQVAKAVVARGLFRREGLLNLIRLRCRVA